MSAHLHHCPECGKAIPHEGDDCEAFITSFLSRFPCQKMRQKQAIAPVGTCMHCGQVELAESEMERLSDGSPSNMCRSCGDDLRAASEAYKAEALNRWPKESAAEDERAESAERWKSMSKSERRQAMAGKASGNLF